MTAPPEARVSHRTRSRVRVRIPSRRGDAGYFETLRERLSRHRDVEDIRVNPLTGSLLLVASEGARDALRVLDEFEDLLSLVEAPKEPLARISDQTVQPIFKLDKRLNQMTGGLFGMNDLVFNGMIAMGLFQIFRGRIEAPPWYTAFLVAHSIYFRAMRGEDAVIETGIPDTEEG
jgi:hypothetical protein